MLKVFIELPLSFPIQSAVPLALWIPALNWFLIQSFHSQNIHCFTRIKKHLNASSSYCNYNNHIQWIYLRWASLNFALSNQLSFGSLFLSLIRFRVDCSLFRIDKKDDEAPAILVWKTSAENVCTQIINNKTPRRVHTGCFGTWSM